MWNSYATLILGLLQATSVLSTKESTDFSKDTMTDDVTASLDSFLWTGQNAVLSKEDGTIVIPTIATSSTLEGSAVTNVATTSSNNPSTKPTIPLVLMLLNADYFVRPTEIINLDWIGDEKFLGGATEFSTTLENYKEDPRAENEPTVKIQIYLCAMGNFEKGYSKYGKQHNDQYCTYRTTFKKQELLKCEFEPEPFVEKVNLSINHPKKKQTDFHCGPQKRGAIYRFVYKICTMSTPITNENVLESDFKTLMFNKINQRDIFEVYRFCYDKQNNEVIYTKHDITSADLLFDDNLIYEREKQYPMMSDGYNYFEEQFKEIAQDYIKLEKFQEQLKAEGDSTTKLYQAQKLSPDEDMEFALWRKTTFHYLNVRPMESQQAKLWNEINLRIRRSTIKLKDHNKYAFQTGVLTMDENRNKSPIMGKITSPDIWLKVINDKLPYFNPRIGKFVHDGIAIIMNTNYGNPAADAFFNNICEKNWCRKSLLGEFSEEVVKTVGCCPVTSEILAFFNSNWTVGNRLEIDDLLDKNDDTTDKVDLNVSAENEGQMVTETEEQQSIGREEQGHPKKPKLKE